MSEWDKIIEKGRSLLKKQTLNSLNTDADFKQFKKETDISFLQWQEHCKIVEQKLNNFDKIKKKDKK